MTRPCPDGFFTGSFVGICITGRVIQNQCSHSAQSSLFVAVLSGEVGSRAVLSFFFFFFSDMFPCCLEE